MKSKYLGKTYGGYKVISIRTNKINRHSYYTLKKLNKKLVIDGNNMFKLARHQITVKKLLKK